MIYRPGMGSPLTKEQAQQVGSILETLGEFTPSDIIQAARPEDSPLHEHFDWDDVSAAEKYRIVQARHLVNTLTVIVKVNGRDTETKAFHSIVLRTSDDQVEHRYAAIKVVSANTDMREQVIQKALAELESWQKRYDQYVDIFGADLFKQINKSVDRVRRRQASTSIAPTV